MADHFDVIIIGGGNAGFGVSAVANDAGKSIAFIENRDFGGTCPNRGCTPKKVLVAAAHALHEIDLAPIHGIQVNKPTLDWAKLIDREKDMIGFIPDAMRGVAEKRGSVFEGSARFVAPNAVEVGGTVIEGDNIVIATGSTPRPLPIEGAEHMITSDEVLSERERPDRIVFIGGGVIAMEFSHVYARAGTRVTILEALPQLLPRMDADAVAAIREETERLGVEIKTGVTVSRIDQVNGALRVTFEHDGKEQTVEADRVVNGAGRLANVEGLNLEAGNVRHDGIRIEVDEFLRSISNPSVWVAGDALVQSPQLSPLATYEGRLVGHNIVNGPSRRPDYSVIPSAVYTVPALSTVGITEQEAHDRGMKVKVTTSDMSGWFSAKTYAEPVAWSKVLVNEESDQIVGAHMVGHTSEELIHLFAMAMQHGITASALKEGPYAFPTFSSDVKNLL
ncbi:MAG: NAD(P)/FAD-dependent oxidoreductase [Pseudomonadota bacterium]